MFCRFEDENRGEVLRKTRGHATLEDIEEGRSTFWERAGNGHADRFAKLGARKHGFTDLQFEEVKALSRHQVGLAKALAHIAAHIVDKQLADSDPRPWSSSGRPNP